jgi:glycyl-tRNA synthetase beta subunit
VQTQIDSLINDSLILSHESNDVIKHILLCSESPIIYLGDYKNIYDLPDKIRQAIMIYHQNFVPLFNKDSSLSSQFLLYANTKMDDDGVQLKADAAQILGMRLQEAEYFWKKDIQTTYETYTNLLRKSTFYEGLGSLYDQSKRFEFMVGHFFPQVPHLQAAAKFLNLDLCMQTVFEVPDLHGIASGLYAVQVCGQDPLVEKIVSDSIYPKNEGQLPKSKAGAMLGFCVRLDQLVGFFGTSASNISKGSSDQFGLRRAAFGLIRLGYFLRDLPDLRDMITHSISLYSNQGIKILPNTLTSVMEFIQKRAVVFLGQNSPKFAQAFVIPGIITWQEDLKLDSFMLNQQTHEALMTSYKRLAGICKSATEAIKHRFENQYLSSLNNLINTLNPMEYDDILNLSTHVDTLLNNIHLNSLDINDKAVVMHTLSRAKDIFDNYCDFKSMM